MPTSLRHPARSATEAAHDLGIDPSTLGRWVDLGLVTPSGRTLGGSRRRGRLYFTPERVEEIRQQMTALAAQRADQVGVETP